MHRGAVSGGVAIVLPPREGFQPGAVGAVGLVVRGLVRAGAAGTVVGLPTSGAPFPDVPFRPAPPGWGWSRIGRYTAGILRALRDMRPDAIEVHNRPDIALRLARALPGTPVALFLHNDPRSMRQAGTPAQRSVLLRRLALVACVSAWLRDRFMEGVDGPAPAVLPNGIDVSELPPPVPRQPLILFAGRVVADKGADAFVAACAAVLPQLPGWRAVMIGADRFRGDSPDTPFLRRIRPQAVRAGIEMLGYRPHGDVLAALAQASIAVVPSRWDEPFGLAALEAMAAGTPLICSGRGALPEVAGDAARYADPDRPDALAGAILDLASSPQHRAALSQAGQVRAGQFDIRQSAAALLALRQASYRRRSSDDKA